MILTRKMNQYTNTNIVHITAIFNVLLNRNIIYCESFEESAIKATMANSNIKTKHITDVKRNHCSNQTINNSESIKNHEQKDIVLQQYLSLPYPAITNDVLDEEKYYYEQTPKTINAYGEMRIKPFRGNPGITLESINHYLYQGKNLFR